MLSLKLPQLLRVHQVPRVRASPTNPHSPEDYGAEGLPLAMRKFPLQANSCPSYSTLRLMWVSEKRVCGGSLEPTMCPHSDSSRLSSPILSCPLTLALLFLICSVGIGTMYMVRWGSDLVSLWGPCDIQRIFFTLLPEVFHRWKGAGHSDCLLSPSHHYPRCSGKMASCRATGAPRVLPWTVSSAPSR